MLSFELSWMQSDKRAGYAEKFDWASTYAEQISISAEPDVNKAIANPMVQEWFRGPGEDTPFFQIGEMKYGRPILVWAYDPKMGFEEAVKLLLVSFDSTPKANLTVGAPFDFLLYEADSLQTGKSGRIEVDDPYFQKISAGWSAALTSALDGLDDFTG